MHLFIVWNSVFYSLKYWVLRLQFLWICWQTEITDACVGVQESIMDFYWHYVSKDTIDEAGKDSFLRAISIASQVFNSISEYIQVSHSTLMLLM